MVGPEFLKRQVGVLVIISVPICLVIQELLIGKGLLEKSRMLITWILTHLRILLNIRMLILHILMD